MAEKLADALAYPPRLMPAERSAAYVSVSRTKFLELVEKGVFPQPKDLDGMPRWDRVELDAAADALEQRRSSARRRSFDEVMRDEDGQGGPAVRQ